MKTKSSELTSPDFTILPYMNEIDLLLKWKTIPLGSFYNLGKRKIHKTYSYRLADKLVNAGVAQRTRPSTKNFQVLIPTKAMLDSTGSIFKNLSFNEYCKVAFIASAFLELTVFHKKIVRFLHEEDENFHPFITGMSCVLTLLLKVLIRNLLNSIWGCFWSHVTTFLVTPIKRR